MIRPTRRWKDNGMDWPMAYHRKAGSYKYIFYIKKMTADKRIISHAGHKW
jgi:hypothetical protein